MDLPVRSIPAFEGYLISIFRLNACGAHEVTKLTTTAAANDNVVEINGFIIYSF